MKQNNEHIISDLQNKISETEGRMAKLLLEMKELDKQRDILLTEYIGEKLLKEKHQKDLDWEIYQTSSL